MEKIIKKLAFDLFHKYFKVETVMCGIDVSFKTDFQFFSDKKKGTLFFTAVFSEDIEQEVEEGWSRIDIIFKDGQPHKATWDIDTMNAGEFYELFQVGEAGLPPQVWFRIQPKTVEKSYFLFFKNKQEVKGEYEFIADPESPYDLDYYLRRDDGYEYGDLDYSHFLDVYKEKKEVRDTQKRDFSDSDMDMWLVAGALLC